MTSSYKFTMKNAVILLQCILSELNLFADILIVNHLPTFLTKLQQILNHEVLQIVIGWLFSLQFYGFYRWSISLNI